MAFTQKKNGNVFECREFERKLLKQFVASIIIYPLDYKEVISYLLCVKIFVLYLYLDLAGDLIHQKKILNSDPLVKIGIVLYLVWGMNNSENYFATSEGKKLKLYLISKLKNTSLNLPLLVLLHSLRQFYFPHLMY